MILTKIVRHGDDLAIELPEEVLKRLGVGLGDTVKLEVVGRSFHISVDRPDDTLARGA